MTHTEYRVIVWRKYDIDSHFFRDERKARDYYTDMLVRYPNYKVELKRV